MLDACQHETIDCGRETAAVWSNCELALFTPASQHILDKSHADMEQIRHFLTCQLLFVTDSDDLATQIFRVWPHAAPPNSCYSRVKTALTAISHQG